MGASRITSMSAERTASDPLRRIPYVLLIVTGTTGTPDLTARANVPRLNGCNDPVLVRVPSGKSITDFPSLIFAAADSRLPDASLAFARSMTMYGLSASAQPQIGTRVSSFLYTI